MIIVGTRVLVKCGELISNFCRSQYRWVRERLFGNVVSSVGGKKYIILFDNGITKEIQSNLLHIEDSSAGVPISEAIATSVEATEMDNNIEENSVEENTITNNNIEEQIILNNIKILEHKKEMLNIDIQILEYKNILLQKKM